MAESIEWLGKNGVFATKLTNIIKEKGLTQKWVAQKVGAKEQTISQYAKGKVLPNAQMLYDIAKCLEVSADFLLGISDTQSPDIDVQTIHNKTGLSELAISYLINSNWRINDPNLTSGEFANERDALIAEEFLCFVNYIIEEFDFSLMIDIIKYCNTCIKFNKANEMKNALIGHTQENFDNTALKDFFDCISINNGKISITVNPDEAQFAMLGYMAEKFKELISKYAQFKIDKFNAGLRTESTESNSDTSDDE